VQVSDIAILITSNFNTLTIALPCSLSMMIDEPSLSMMIDEPSEEED
jgi:hypothetical protein